MAANNGYLEYEVDGTRFRHLLYIDSITQPQALTGTSVQSRMTRRFYPRSHMPGDITVTGRCLSQTEYQKLGLFIRKHQRAMINTPPGIVFHKLNTTNPGYRRLMKLYVYREGVLVRGFIERFTISKRGVFDPAPQFTFSFKVIYDPNSSDITLSRALVSYTEGGDQSFSKSTANEDVITPDAPDATPVIEDVTDVLGGLLGSDGPRE